MMHFFSQATLWAKTCQTNPMHCEYWLAMTSNTTSICTQLNYLTQEVLRLVRTMAVSYHFFKNQHWYLYPKQIIPKKPKKKQLENAHEKNLSRASNPSTLPTSLAPGEVPTLFGCQWVIASALFGYFWGREMEGGNSHGKITMFNRILLENHLFFWGGE